MIDYKETTWNYIQGEKTGTFYSAEPKWIRKIHKWKEEYPDDVDIRFVNENESLVVRLPAKWFAVRPPKRMSEESKRAASERMRNRLKNMTDIDEDEEEEED